MKELVWFATEITPRSRFGRLPEQERYDAVKEWIGDRDPWYAMLCRTHFDDQPGIVHMVEAYVGRPFMTFTVHPDGAVRDIRPPTIQGPIPQPVRESTGWRYLLEEIENADDFRPLRQDTRLTPRRTIGEGAETVYVYTTQGDESLGRVKVGMTTGDPADRIWSQFGTSNSSGPIWLLHIQTDDAVLLERLIHHVLKQNGRSVADAPGTEWFTASVDEVEKGAASR